MAQARRRAPTLFLAATLFVAGACGDRAAASAPPSLAPVPAPVAAMLSWLQERTMTCGQASDDRWVCQLDAGEGQTNPSDRTVTTVTIDVQDGAIAEVSATLDARRNPVPLASVVCPNLVCDVTTGFFSETIGLSPVTGLFGEAISKWVDANHVTGGQASFGPMVVTLSPSGPLIAMRLNFSR